MIPLTLIFKEGGGGAIYLLVGQTILLLGRSLLAVLSAVIYHELRVSREGLEIKQLGSVFE